MGLFLNPDDSAFLKNKRNDEYVDKSMLIGEMNEILDSENNYVCISRPRRFGKTMAANMLAAYYSKGADSHEAFKGLKIESDPSFEEYINKYNVLKIDCAGIYYNREECVSFVQELASLLIPEFRRQFPDLVFPETCGLVQAIRKVYGEKNEQFVIILDEYDVLIRERNDDETGRYLSFLSGLFKDSSIAPAIALSYITGILPVVRDVAQSKLNNFTEYTMIRAGRLAPYIGFTKDEVKVLAEKNGMDMKELESWYDGYCVDDVELYSPKSVIEAIKEGQCGDYWTATGSYEAVRKYIEYDFEGMEEDVTRMVAGECVPVEVGSYLNNMESFSSKDDVFTYLIHLGYLAYDSERRTCRIPNKEIRNQWAIVLKNSRKFRRQSDAMNLSRSLLMATIDMDSDAVAEALDRSHELVTSNLSYNNEQSLQSAIILAYYYATEHYTILKEMDTGKGYADVVMIPYEPDKPALVIELKKDKSEGKAIRQIKEKHYYSGLEQYEGNILLVGINYDSRTKEHKCIIERA